MPKNIVDNVIVRPQNTKIKRFLKATRDKKLKYVNQLQKVTLKKLRAFGILTMNSVSIKDRDGVI